jgi:predicted O-methyltransferase YrrM
MAWKEVVARVDRECREQSIPMIGPEKAAVLVELIREKRPEVIVEVGTAIGYSGLWIGATLRELGTGKLLTLEMDPQRASIAARNFQEAGVQDLITQYLGDAREKIREIEVAIDFLFLDGGFANYYPCLLAARDRLRDGAVLLADNAGIGADEMADYLNHVRKNYPSRTQWFDTDLAWNPRDAMEISSYRVAGWTT